jgi:radical SAM superfamily enzyme YgiQ (UPF0313 family)
VKSICYINPASNVISYYGSEVVAASGREPACVVADLAITTVAALTPRDFAVRLWDESLGPVDLDMDVDFVGITGKSSQADRMIRLADEFRARGKTVIIGGPYASLSPARVREHCDILVRGEIEAIAGELFADLAAGTWRDEYVGGRPDITRSPVPRWDLYPNDRAIDGALQTSRGCPFECEFCDVIQYLGRKQRFKTPAQIVAELDELARHGYRRAFLCDDNFTVARKRAREVLEVMRDWNARRGPDGALAFHTQASIEAAEDLELLRLCVEAGLTTTFIGIETPSEESLRETRKFQNLRRSMQDSIETFVATGIAVRGGLIAGFDSDGPDIFERLYEFGMSLPIPFFSLTALAAQEATPLYARLAAEGRLVDDGDPTIGELYRTNVVPLRMTREELFLGLKWLGNALYHPRAFRERMRRFLALFGTAAPASLHCRTRWRSLRRVELDQLCVIKNLRKRGPDEDALVREVLDTVTARPWTGPEAMDAMLTYAQIRYAYELAGLWDPSVVPAGPFGGRLVPDAAAAIASASDSMVG